jgi:hypothetical protein
MSALIVRRGSDLLQAGKETLAQLIPGLEVRIGFIGKAG